MRLNITHSVSDVYSRNDFVDAVNAKKNVIELKGGVLQEIKKEINGSKSVTSFSKLGRGIGALGVTLGLFSPAGYIGLGGAAIYAILFGTSSAMLRSDQINKYSIYIFSYKGEERFLLVRTKVFDKKLDSIEGYEYVVFNTSHHCPKCDKSAKKENDGFFCPSCHRRIVKSNTATIK